MAKLFSFASWNVEHFTNDPSRVSENIAFIQNSDPDVFAIFEVLGKEVFFDFVEQMPSHNFFITEDLSHMETLIGVRQGLTAFVTQRQKFKSDIPTLRPGSLVTLTIDGEYYSLLFLHIKSLPDPRSWGLRDDMIGHVFDLKKALDRAPGVPEEGANFIVLGDLNTMGMNLTYSDKDVSGQEEIERYAKRLEHRKLRLLPKTEAHTWWGGEETTNPKSDLDHAFGSEELTFKSFAGGAEIDVRGWPKLANESAQSEWSSQHSDHAMLFGAVMEG